MIHFPLSTANAFLPGVAKLKGDIDGSMTVEGDMARPILNGWLAFDSAAVTVDMLGSTLELPGEHIPVENNIVRLNNLKIKACNDNPLTVAGTVDLSELSSPGIDLSFNASNMQLVNTVKAPRGADVFGKLFLGLNATSRRPDLPPGQRPLRCFHRCRAPPGSSSPSRKALRKPR